MKSGCECLTRRHDVHGFVIRDPIEQELFSAGVLTMQDLETSELKAVLQPSVLERYRKTKQEEDLALEQVFKRLKVPYTRFSTGAAYDRPLAGHLQD